MDGTGMLVISESDNPAPSLTKAVNEVVNNLLRRLGRPSINRLPEDEAFPA